MKLAARWAAFERVAIPAHASIGQRRQMKRAFYSGAAALYNELVFAGDATLDEVDPERAARSDDELERMLDGSPSLDKLEETLAGIADEIQMFAFRVRSGLD